MRKLPCPNSLIASIMICALLVAVTSSSANAMNLAVDGYWYKNGVNMAGHHNTIWIQPLDRKITGSSNAQTPRGVIQQIYVDVRELDRCRNADGTWQSWNTYAYNNAIAYWVYGTGSINAQGTYQNCVYGHEYQNQSLHNFYDPGFGINESHWLYSS